MNELSPLVLESIADVLHDYCRFSVPDEFLIKVIESDDELRHEIFLSGGVSDTYVRELIISAVCREMDIKIDVPNIFGMVGSHEWPCYGDSLEYKHAFDIQFSKRLAEIGGTIYD